MKSSESKLTYNRNYYYDNIEYCRDRQMDYYNRKKEERLEYQRKYYQEHRERLVQIRHERYVEEKAKVFRNIVECLEG